MNVSELLEKVINMNASDLHLSVGVAPIVRTDTVLKPMQEEKVLTIEDINLFLQKVLDQQQANILEVNKEVDFSISLGDKARFRVNAYYQKGYPSVALRLISYKIPSLEELHLPTDLAKLCNLKQGLVLVVGPTGHGKSTTIASMIDSININRSEHIITIEDPIEYLFVNKKSLIEQREMYLDTHSWDSALRAILRQDPNIVFIGEMRDAETMHSALNIAETGHLVFSTLHTNSAAQSIDRIISSFPEAKQAQIKPQLAQVVEAIISQRLIVSDSKGVVPAIELLIVNDAVRNLIREGKSYQIDNVIRTGANTGMQSLEVSLAYLVSKGDISSDEALKYANDVGFLRRLLKGISDNN